MEVQKHQQLPKHANLVRLYRAWQERGRLYIQIELCDASLADLQVERHGPLPEKLVWTYLADLLLAVKHLHDHDLIHLDIKPENIFISHDGICKLGDFGLVCDIKKNGTADAQEGDSKYMAPELLHTQPTKAADIFSLGVSILEISTDLDVPHRGVGWQLLRKNQLPEDLLEHVSPNLRHAIGLMMEADPRLRPNARDLLNVLPSLKPVLFRRKMYHTWRSTCNNVRDAVFNVYLFMAILLKFLWEHVILGSIAWFSTNGRKSSMHPDEQITPSNQFEIKRVPKPSRDFPNIGDYEDMYQSPVVSKLQFDMDDDEEETSSSSPDNTPPETKSLYGSLICHDTVPEHHDPGADWLDGHGAHDISSIPSSPLVPETPINAFSSPPIQPMSRLRRAGGKVTPHRLAMIDDDTSGSDNDDPSHPPKVRRAHTQPVSSTPAQKNRTRSGAGRAPSSAPRTERITRSKRRRPENELMNHSFGAFGDHKCNDRYAAATGAGSADSPEQPFYRRPSVVRRPFGMAGQNHPNDMSPPNMVEIQAASAGLEDSPSLFRHRPAMSSVSDIGAGNRPYRSASRNLKLMFDDHPGSSSADEF